ncbi:hypothetical protein IWW50_005819 [Coemansia erecta]|nr:hypothetical protein GGF43_004427 [Coemansia sp. RSA 2618]KAJ2818438.1 hypothetical protein IWW50_005819 [Coemansia erecta]
MADTDHAEQQPANDGEAPPTYEETLETLLRKRYILKRPQILSRTVHAVDVDTGKQAYTKKMKGLSSSKMLFYAHGDTDVVWSCKREQQGFELVFSRRVGQAVEPELLPDTEYQGSGGPEGQVGANDGLATDTAANLLDNKPVDASREYIHRENDDAPPAYEESDPATEQQVRLVSTDPIPFAYDFTLPGTTTAGDRSSSSTADGSTHRWLRNPEVKNANTISPERPWTEFMCVESTTGRMLAEVVHYAKREPHMGTLIISGDLEPGQHEFLVVSAIPVVEEYPARHLAHLNRTESQS